MRSGKRPSGLARSWLRHWLLLLVVLLAWGRGIWALGGKSLWWDESLSLQRARSPLVSVLTNKIILTDNVTSVETTDNHPPLYFLLLWAVVRVLGESEFALRLPSLAAAVLTVVLLYVTGKRLIDRRAGLAAAALGALSPMYLWYAQEARMYTLLAFLSLLSFYCFVRAFFHPSGLLDLRRDWRWAVACILASLAVVLTHYLGLLLVAFEVLALGLISLRQAKSRRTLALIVSALLLLSLPVLAYAWFTLPHGKQPGFYSIPLGDLLRDLLNSFSLGLSVNIDHWYVLLIDFVFLLFLLAGFLWLVRPGAAQKRKSAAWLLVGYLSVPVIAIFLLAFIQPAYMNSRHLIFITPPFYLLIGAGLTRWRGKLQGLALLGGLLMVVGMGYSTWNYLTAPEYNKDNHREWGAYLREHVRPGDVVVVDPPHIAELYRYYADSGAPWVGLPLLNGSRADTVALLEDLFRQYDRVWLAVSRTPPWGDRGRVPQKWLDSHAFRTAYKPIHSYASAVSVAAYLPDWPSIGRLPPEAQPLEVRYSPALRLIGHQLLSLAQPGKQLHVALYWAVDEPIPEQASMVLRLVDDRGHLWGQGEQCPFNGLYPMWQWQPGLRLPDEHELYIEPGTPPGTYQMELVLVSRPTEDGCLGPPGEIMPPSAAPPQANRGDRMLLGMVSVERPAAPAATADLGMGRRHQARFDGLQLLGSDYGPEDIEPGQRLHISLYWQARQTPLLDAIFRLRLVDASGEAQQESVIRPVGDSYPASQWQAGDRFKGQFWLRIPEEAPGGRYRLELVPEPPLKQNGLWAALRRRLGAEEAGITLGRVQVTAQPASEPSAPLTPVPLPTNLAPEFPLVATLGDQVRFLGYDLNTEAVYSGQELSFTLYWQALRPIDHSYTVFTHLLGPENEVLGQKDSIPRGGAYPTTRWQPGEVVADTYRFTVAPDAPPGNYPLEAGMYRLETGARLPATDADGQPLPHDRILLAEIAVLQAPTPTPFDPASRHWTYLPLIVADEE